MDSDEARALIRLGHPRFRNFSGAVEPVLGAIADVIPGTIVLGRVEPDEQGCRVIDVRGAGVSGISDGAGPPSEKPRRQQSRSPGSANNECSASIDLDDQFLQSLDTRERIGMPLEMSSGKIVGILSALEGRPGTYGDNHVAILEHRRQGF